MERAAANCPVALRHLGADAHVGGRYTDAMKHLKKAVALGNIDANYQISVLYGTGGNGVEKNEKKRIAHLETAAIGGHPGARLDLAEIEMTNQRPDRAIKHYVIAAKLGEEIGLQYLRYFYDRGLKKEVFAEALRGYQIAVDATKSPQREEAQKFSRRMKSAYARMKSEQGS